MCYDTGGAAAVYQEDKENHVLSLAGFINSPFSTLYYYFPQQLVSKGLTDYRYPLFFNLAYLFAAVFFLFISARERYGGTIAVLAAVFFSLYPGVYVFSRWILKDYSLLALNTISFYLLLKTKEFNRPVMSILAGFFLGIGYAFRDTIVIYMAGPLITALAGAFADIFKKKPLNPTAGLKRMMNILLYSAGVILVVFRRYSTAEMLIMNLGRLKVSVVNSGSLYSGMRHLFGFLISPVFFLFLCIAVILTLSSKKTREDYYYLSWFFFPLFLFSFVFRDRQIEYYFLPVIPAAALISCAAIKKLFISKKGKAIIFLVILWGSGQYYRIFSCTQKEEVPGQFESYEKFIIRPPKRSIISDVQRILKENRESGILFLHSQSSAGHESWIFPLYVLMYSDRANSAMNHRFMPEDDHNGMSKIGALLREADLLFYCGPQDLKEGSFLQEYLESFLEQQIKHAFFHAHNFPPGDYEKIITKRNINLLFSGKSGEEIIADFAANFRSYELLEKKEYRYPENRLYVYKKRGKKTGVK